MKLFLNTAATGEVVTVEEQKSFMKIDIDDEDSIIEQMISAATKRIEEYCRISILTQKWNVYYNSLSDKMELPRAPLQSIDNFYYYDDDYSQNDMDENLYKVFTFEGVAIPGYIRRLKNQSWPTYTTNGDGIKIEFTSGFGDDSSDVPPDIVMAVFLIVSFWFENRESQEMPIEAINLIEKYKVFFP